jgi:hypothetical protein
MMESPPSGFMSNASNDGTDAKRKAVTEVMVSARNIQLKTPRIKLFV